MVNQKDIGVTHWVDGSNTWRLGLVGFATKFRGYILSLVLTLPLAGTPFWWPKGRAGKDTISVPLDIVIMIFGILLVLLVTCLFFYFKHRVRRSLRIKSQLHSLAHEIRDSVSELLRRTHSKPGRVAKSDFAHERRHLLNFSTKVAELIREYFKLMAKDDSVGCCIRIGADSPKDGIDEVHYFTVGRSGVNPARAQTSEPVSRSEGIPKFFLTDDVACQGVLYFADLEKAALNGVYVKKKNHELYPDDIKSMIVAPMNGWNGKGRDLIGLLYVTSKSKKLMHPRNVDLMKFTADTLAAAYITIFSRLQSTGRMPELQVDNGEDN